MRVFACLALLSSLVLLPVPLASAQQAPTECRYAGMAFGQAATVRDGNRVLRCGPGGWFSDSSVPPTNCVYASGMFTAGAIITEGERTVTCQADGTWSSEAP